MALTYSSVYLHPWDAVDEGVATVVSRLVETGFTHINLASSYHSGRFILPHNPKRRVYVAEEGVVYFKPDPRSYVGTKLLPRRSSNYADTDVLELVSGAADDAGVKVNSWTVCLHNSAHVSQHPDVGVVDAYGAPDPNFMCPNNPDVRNYLLGLVRDLSSRYSLDFVQLESPVYPFGLEHGDHHEFFGVPVEPIASYLYPGCFCRFCVAKAREVGIDLPDVQKRVKQLIDISLQTPARILKNVPEGDTFRSMHDLIREDEMVTQLFGFKTSVWAEVLSQCREVVRENGGSRLSLITGALFKGPEGVPVASVSKIVDAIDLICYFENPERVYYYVKWVKHQMSQGCRLIPALRMNYPIAYSPETISRSVDFAIEAGGDGLAFYNYGWTPFENLAWVKAALEKHS